MRESEVIARFFDFAPGDNAPVGVGDDAAVLSPPPQTHLACGSDSLIEDVHFFSDDDSFFLARKAAAVSLSDLAATGARPLWMTVALAADKNAEWFARFAEGLKSSAAEYQYAIVGGDLCRAEKVCITTTAIGALDGRPLLRNGARAGDDVWISGATGEAALAVHCRKTGIAAPPHYLDAINKKLNDPRPRLALGCKLSGIATAAMDISDGLAACARAVAARSGIRIVLQMRDIPIPPPLAALPSSLQNELILNGGDDYELFFCAPKNARSFLEKENAFRIGEVSAGAGADIIGADGKTIRARGYEHDFGE